MKNVKATGKYSDISVVKDVDTASLKGGVR